MGVDVFKNLLTSHVPLCKVGCFFHICFSFQDLGNIFWGRDAMSPCSLILKKKLHEKNIFVSMHVIKTVHMMASVHCAMRVDECCCSECIEYALNSKAS